MRARRRFSPEEQLKIVEESYLPGNSLNIFSPRPTKKNARKFSNKNKLCYWDMKKCCGSV
jgi:hypothetical protein